MTLMTAAKLHCRRRLYACLRDSTEGMLGVTSHPSGIKNLGFLSNTEFEGTLVCRLGWQPVILRHDYILAYTQTFLALRHAFLSDWKYHRCYGYIINRAFRRKKLFQWNHLVFHWCRCAHSWNIFQHPKRNFVSPRGHVISSIISGYSIYKPWNSNTVSPL